MTQNVALTNYVTQMPHLWHRCGTESIPTRFTHIFTKYYHPLCLLVRSEHLASILNDIQKSMMIQELIGTKLYTLSLLMEE